MDKFLNKLLSIWFMCSTVVFPETVITLKVRRWGYDYASSYHSFLLTEEIQQANLGITLDSLTTLSTFQRSLDVRAHTIGYPHKGNSVRKWNSTQKNTRKCFYTCLSINVLMWQPRARKTIWLFQISIILVPYQSSKCLMKCLVIKPRKLS